MRNCILFTLFTLSGVFIGLSIPDRWPESGATPYDPSNLYHFEVVHDPEQPDNHAVFDSKRIIFKFRSNEEAVATRNKVFDLLWDCRNEATRREGK